MGPGFTQIQNTVDKELRNLVRIKYQMIKRLKTSENQKRRFLKPRESLP